MHMVSKNGLNEAELETVRVSKNPTVVMTANREVLAKEEATVYVTELDLFVTSMPLEDTPAVLSLGNLCEDHGYNYHWTSGQKPLLIKNGRKIDCHTANYVPFVVPSLSTSSSSSFSPTSPTSSSQEAVIRIQHPASTRCEFMSEEVRGDSSRGLPEWPEEFWENLADESVREHRDTSSSCHELPSEPRAKVVSGKHSIFTHFPKDRNCDFCLRNKITRASCRRRTGTIMPRAEHFGDLITADHKVLSEECESRHNHRYAVVAQDLATQWIQSHPFKTETSREAQKSLQKFLEPNRKPKVIYADNSPRIWQIL